MELIGWIGGILLAFCGLPQAIQSIRQGHSVGLTWGLLGAWFGGELFTIAYVIPKMDWPLIFNYGANIFFLLIIIKYKIWPRG